MPYPSNVKRSRHRLRTIQRHSIAAAGAGSTVEQGNHDLLARICEFMSHHRLAVTGENLSIVCNALSGANAELSRVLAARETAGDPIDQHWLDTLMQFDPQVNARVAELEKLSDQFEDALMRFAQTAKSAQDQTTDGREALDAQINRFEESIPQSQKGSEFDRVIDLSRAMLDRIEQVESAMERSQAETAELREHLAKARMEADVDHLTRLPNRRAFERRFVAVADEARAIGVPLSVAFCDVDHFKAVNDAHGHPAGDRVLVEIASTLNDIASDECFVARHGGEEFVLLFHGLDKEAAWRRLDGARRVMAQRQLINRDSGRPFGRITFSGGIAEVTEDADTRSALSRADAALYQAKAEGRNRIIAL